MLLISLSLVVACGLVVAVVLPAFAGECHPSWYLDDEGRCMDDDGQNATSTPSR
jgi:hypothetical protein